MASSSHCSVSESIGDDFLTCHICFEAFTDPRILSCLHTYCFQCICTHVTTAQTDGCAVVCPECREPFSEMVSSLKTNFFIKGLAEVNKEKSADRLPCGICHLRGKDTIAKVKCLDCGDHLCSTCSDGHNASSLTWKHEKISLDDIKQGTYDEKLRQLQKIKCLKHTDKDVEFYCQSCSRSVCLTCVLLEHRDHKCKTISEAVSEKKSNIIGLTEKLRENLMMFINEEKEVASKLEILTNKEKKERMEIEKQAQLEIAKINAQKELSLERIARKTKASQKGYKGQLESLRLQISLVSSCVTFSDNILKKGTDEEVLMLETMVTDRLMHLQMDKGGDLDDTDQKSSVTGAKLDQQDTQQTSASYASKVTAAAQKTSSQFDTSYETVNAEADERSNGDNTTSSNAGARSETEARLKFRMMKFFSSECSGDETKPGIKGMVYNSQIGIILADRYNGKLKIMNKNGSVLQEITKDGFQPFAVAVADDTIGTVSENFLILFNSEGRFKRKVRLSEQKPNDGYMFTYSLAASETVGFVVGNIHGSNRLTFYNLDGKFTRHLYCSVQFPLAALSITPSGDIVLSEWGCGRIRVIASEGKLKFKTKDSKWRPNGTCTSTDGTIFVADYEHGAISAYSSDGDFLHEHSTRSDGMGNPKYICIDESDLLYVVDYAGKICVYKVCT